MLTRTAVPRGLAAGTALLVLGATAACGDSAAGSSGADGTVPVVTAFYPLQFISERIGGDAVTVTNLTKPGTEPHDLELSPRQVGDISDAKLVIYLKGFQPEVDKAVEQEAHDRAFDVSTVAPLQPLSARADNGALDPHVWLDPSRLATIADRLAARLGEADATHAADYTARARTLRSELDTLDAEYAEALATCRRREIVTSHSAFNYLATRYHLTQVGITGIEPESEPSAQRLADAAAEARRTGATTIFFETLVSPKVADTIAREVGAKTAGLDPLEGLTQPGGDYLSVMRTNLTALTAALGCS